MALLRNHLIVSFAQEENGVNSLTCILILISRPICFPMDHSHFKTLSLMSPLCLPNISAIVMMVIFVLKVQLLQLPRPSLLMVATNAHQDTIALLEHQLRFLVPPALITQILAKPCALHATQPCIVPILQWKIQRIVLLVTIAQVVTSTQHRALLVLTNLLPVVTTVVIVKFAQPPNTVVSLVFYQNLASVKLDLYAVKVSPEMLHT
mmetsp:Transcript_50620/g.69369  ORF Transcript_50620/g.69369 Transcript_50620/m.69369 type:complete len:207 (+) Transcript_50620:2202-2822(+)